MDESQVGTFPWNTKTVSTASLNDGNNVYFVNPDGTVVAISLATGKVVWQSTPIPSTEYVYQRIFLTVLSVLTRKVGISTYTQAIPHLTS